MKAVVYEGARKVSVKEVPDARIEQPTDVLVRITTTNICGADLHMYEGRTDFEPGRWFGHENLGQVVEVGAGVDKVKVGDFVVLPFNVACGHCKNGERGLTNDCLTAQPVPERAGAAYGFADMGPWAGGQAELLRVPWGDFDGLRLGEDAEERQADHVMLAEQIGAIAIDDSAVDPVEAVNELIMGLGADNGCECVGYQAHDPAGDEHPNLTLDNLVRSVRSTGAIGVVGVFVPQDPGGPDELAERGEVAFDFGQLWFPGQKLGSGQCPVKKDNRALRDLVAGGRATRRGSSATSSPSTRHRRRTRTSTPGTRAGPRSSCTRATPRRGRDVAGGLSGRRVAILATDGVERVEPEQPRQALDEAGAETVLLSVRSGSIAARGHDLRMAGAEVVDEEVVSDGSLTTSRSPDDLPASCQATPRTWEAGRGKESG